MDVFFVSGDEQGPLAGDGETTNVENWTPQGDIEDIKVFGE